MRHDLFDRRFQDQPPFEEAWFIECTLDDDRALWLRYTITATAEGVVAGTQAMVLDGDRKHVRQGQTPWSTPGAGLTHPAGLSPGRAQGSIEDIRWELTFGAAVGHPHVPRRLQRLGLSGRTYASPGLDLAVEGQVTIGERTWDVRDAPGALGHIWGPRANTRAWGWVHASQFDSHPQVQVEVLTARLGLGPLTLPWASSIVVNIPRGRWSMTRTRDLFRPRIEIGGDRLSLAVTHRGAHLALDAAFPHANRTFQLSLPHASGATTTVRNSPVSTLRLTLDHPEWGRLALQTTRASLELARR